MSTTSFGVLICMGKKPKRLINQKNVQLSLIMGQNLDDLN